MRAGVQDFNVINLGDLEVKFAEGEEVSLETLQVNTHIPGNLHMPPVNLCLQLPLRLWSGITLRTVCGRQDVALNSGHDKRPAGEACAEPVGSPCQAAAEGGYHEHAVPICIRLAPLADDDILVYSTL